jgi:hypothetical protein
MATDDVQVINHHQANLLIKEKTTTREVAAPTVTLPSGQVVQTGPATTKTSTSYKSSISISVESEPIAFMLDEGVVAKKAAEMLAQRIREQTGGITAMVKPATAKARAVQSRAFSKGESWAVKQFSGGRMGATPPVAGELRQFNHSGRLRESIVASFVQQNKEWRINFAANRWDIKHWKDEAKMRVAFQKWVALVPVLQDASSDMGIQRAIRETFAEVMVKGKMGEDHRAAKLRGEAFVKAIQLAQRVLAA